MNIKLLTNDKKLGDAKNAKKCLPRKSFIQDFFWFFKNGQK